MVRQGPRREKQFSMRHNRKSLRIAEMIITRLASIWSQKEKHINNMQQHHFLLVISVTMVRPHKRNFWHSKVTFKALSKTTSLIQDREGREVLFFTGGIDPPWEFITVSVCKFTIPNETQHLLWLYSTHGTCFLFIYWSGTILGSLNLNLSTRPVKNMGPKWPTTYHLCKGADNDVWPVGRWWHRKPPSSWDFPCKPLREASLSKLSSRMIRPKMDRLSSWELWKSASQKGGVSVRGQKHVM